MGNQIQIKRSNTSATPTTTLQGGELAYSYNSNAIFIGAQTGVGAAAIKIGGAKYGYLDSVSAPGTLTSNAAVIVDANSFVSNTFTQGLVIHPSEGTITVNTSVAFINSISSQANSSQLGSISSSGSNNELATTWAISNYVTNQVINATTPAGSNGQFQYNNSGTIAGTSNFTYNNVLGIVSVGNSTVNVQTGYITTQQATQINYGNVNNYIQGVINNINTGSSSSTDWIAYNDHGLAANSYIDMGINGSGWSNSTWTINGPNDGYLYTGNGNLSIGSDSDSGTGPTYINFFTDNTLAANERLRINSSSISIASGLNLTLGQTITANGSVGTAGYVLASGGAGTNAYWIASAGVNTAAQYTWTNTQSFSNTITFSGNVNFGNASVNAVAFSNSTATYFTGTAYNANNATYLGGWALANIQTWITTNATASYTNAVSDAKAAIYANNGTFTGNNTFNGTNTVFGSNVAFNGYVTTNIIPSTNNVATLGNTTNRWEALYLSGSTLFIGNSSLSVDASNNFTFGGANSVTVNSAIVNTFNGTTTTFGSNVTLSGSTLTATSTTASFQNVNVSGNLVVSGTVTTINTQQLTVNDNIIEIGSSDGIATSDAVDTGWFTVANTGGTVNYPGFGRIAGSSTVTNPYFKLFTSTTNPNTATTFTTTTTGFLEAYLAPYGLSGAFVANSANLQITANGTYGVNFVANSLTLTTALAATSGGTGYGSYTTGDVLYASSGTALSKLSVPGSAANGQILQIVNNLPAYGTLDGGTF
jgi:hypothetical protein